MSANNMIPDNRAEKLLREPSDRLGSHNIVTSVLTVTRAMSDAVFAMEFSHSPKQFTAVTEVIDAALGFAYTIHKAEKRIQILDADKSPEAIKLRRNKLAVNGIPLLNAMHTFFAARYRDGRVSSFIVRPYELEESPAPASDKAFFYFLTGEGCRTAEGFAFSYTDGLGTIALKLVPISSGETILFELREFTTGAAIKESGLVLNKEYPPTIAQRINNESICRRHLDQREVLAEELVANVERWIEKPSVTEGE